MPKKIDKNFNELENPKIAHRRQVLEELLGDKFNALGKKADLGNATTTDWTDKRIEKPTAQVEKFLNHYGIRMEWWKTGEGEVFKEKNTSVDKTPPIKENREEIYRNLVEENSEYKLVPSELLNGEYRIILNRELEMRDRLLTEQISQQKELIATKNKLIQQLEDEVVSLRGRKQSQKT